MSTIVKLTAVDGTPRYFTPTSISFRPRASGAPGAAVWQGPEVLQHADRCPSDGTMDAGITDEHHVYVRETCEEIVAALAKAGVMVVTP